MLDFNHYAWLALYLLDTVKTLCLSTLIIENDAINWISNNAE